jgi:hypothetical protein
MPRRSWFDAKQGERPTIGTALPGLDTWKQAVEDGVIEVHEVEAQKDLVLQLLRDLEPMLDDTMHERVTRVLEEWTVLSAMQTTLLLEDHTGET